MPTDKLVQGQGPVKCQRTYTRPFQCSQMPTDAQGVAELGDYVWKSVILPTVDEFVAPILYAVPVQLLAYHTAVLKGTDVDQPRNLAKSVTVE